MIACPTKCSLGLAAVAALLAVVLPARANAPVSRYTAASGTVTDTKTGLIWQQPAPTETYTQPNAVTYCSTTLGSPWRLPTIKELQTLVDYSQAALPLIDSSFFSGAASNLYWSSTPLAGSPSAVWYVNFYSGNTGYGDMTGAYYLRCVR